MNTTRTVRIGSAAATALSLVLVASAASSIEREVSGVSFNGTVQIGDTEVPLRGAALLRYRIFFDAYVAAFYAPDTSQRFSPLTAHPRRLEIEYFWPLTAAQFAHATLDGISANVSAAELAQLSPSIARFNKHYEDIEPGDRYALTYADGKTELSKNGQKLGDVEGDAFGAAIFSIWLGRAPLSKSLKADLLGMEPQ
jgi:hypothetical protein